MHFERLYAMVIIRKGVCTKVGTELLGRCLGQVIPKRETLIYWLSKKQHRDLYYHYQDKECCRN